MIDNGIYIILFHPYVWNVGGLWGEKYSGIMTWYSGVTNSTNACNIQLHNAGHADNSCVISARTLRMSNQNQTVDAYLKLQICSNQVMSTADWIFRFKKIMGF